MLALELQILPKQAEFLQSTAKTTIFRGGIGSGKTHVLCLGAINRALAGRRVCITSFSYPMLRDACLTTMRRILSDNAIPFDFAKQEMTMSIGNGKVFFRSGDDPDSLRGPEYHDGFIDEARNFDSDYIYDVLLGRLRLSEDGQVFISTSPHGKDWVYKLSLSDGCQLITQHTGENTFNPKNYVETLRARYGGDYFRQEVEAAIVDSELSIFKANWWKLFDELPPGEPFRVVQSWDTAFKSGAENDESVCTTWAQFKDGYYLVDVMAGRLEYPALKAAMLLQAQIHRPNVILVEDKASGQSLIQEMKAESSLPVLAVKVDSDKVTRAHAATPMIEAGHVKIKASAPWLKKVIDQMSAFPHDKHDDIVDSITQFINWVRRQPTKAPIIASHMDREQSAPMDAMQLLKERTGATPEQDRPFQRRRFIGAGDRVNSFAKGY